MDILQKQDLASASFANDNTNAAGGLAVRTDAGSTVGAAITAATPDATTAVKGLVELATAAETPTLDTARAVTPEGFTTTLAANTAVATTGASRVGFLQQGAGAVGRTLQDRGEDWVSVGDGVTDDTAAIQAAINAHKGKTILFPGGHEYYAAGVVLSGASYNNTTLVLEGEFKMRPAPTLTTTNFSAVWVGIAFQSCDGCSIEGKINGNRAAQQNKEQTHAVVLAGVTNFYVPNLRIREIRGDGMYVTQSNLTASSTNSDGLTIGEITGFNTTDDGRNLVSIISCNNVAIGTFNSLKIGGVVGGAVMPGGLDIEPNQAYQSCKNITVGVLNVETAGTGGLTIQGRAGTDTTSNVVVGVANVVNTCLPTLADGLTNITQTNNHVLVIANAVNITVSAFNGRFTNAYGDAVVVYGADHIAIAGRVSHVREGARIADDVADVTGTGVRFSDISLDVTDSCRYGFRAGKIVDTKIAGDVWAPTTGYYVGSLFAVLARGGYAQTRCTYAVNVPYSANWTRAYRNDASTPCTFVDSVIDGANFSAGASWASYNTMKDMPISIYNSVGYTEGSARGVPTNGAHVAGTYIRNGVPAVGAAKGWVCTVSGTPGTWVSEGNL
jgi:hypothetical protein